MIDFKLADVAQWMLKKIDLCHRLGHKSELHYFVSESESVIRMVVSSSQLEGEIRLTSGGIATVMLVDAADNAGENEVNKMTFAIDAQELHVDGQYVDQLNFFFLCIERRSLKSE